MHVGQVESTSKVLNFTIFSPIQSLSCDAPTEMLRFIHHLLDHNNKRTRKLIHRMRIPGETNPLSKPQAAERGVLHVVATPIGNIKDFSIRALDILKNVDYIACYNSNNTRLLMDVIDMPCRGRLVQIPYENAQATNKLIGILSAGHSMALVSNAGSPMFGDPTGILVHAVERAKYRVTCVPGPCSIVAALCVSGLDFSSCGFRFIGYVSHIAATRRNQLRDAIMHGQSGVTVMFDTPERVIFTLKEIATFAPTRRVSIVHEVTKVNEAVHCQEALTLYRFYERSDMAKQKVFGELVVCVDSMAETTGITTTKYGAFNELEVVRQHGILTASGQSKESALLITASNLNLPVRVVRNVLEHRSYGRNDAPDGATSQGADEYRSWTNDPEVQEKDAAAQGKRSKQILSPAERRRIRGANKRKSTAAVREKIMLLQYKKTHRNN
ncbi:ribosomal RNA small subunit methyltransferase [Perkinsela sp. CCAP 1560/4]|nr:ribosomal RNA small subunit methyltransferase [Perkinsela sp. CCAP 1560/4]KNH05646.1 ribosomal RNA small subunit methyltransferase [Perkinsela sp. CCAP 1560/4]|eukprot:KNH03634.1 ribosomal RNA small subunit methyltransferase [Perkinsela sp. CCAP 1560/4]